MRPAIRYERIRAPAAAAILGLEGPKHEAAMSREILRGVVGSTAHGINIAGQDDRDEMGVFVEAPEHVCGLRSFDHSIYRTQPEGVRSGPGDLDQVMYSLRKFARLAADGNPTVLVLLWLPEYVTKTPLGVALVGMREAFVSREAGKRFLGYLTGQKASLLGERAKKVQRPELVERYGFDTKFAMHALRLGFEGIEYMTEGRLTLPVAEPNLSVLRAVRQGEVSFGETMALIEDAEARLAGLVHASTRGADRAAIDRFLVETHQRHWAAKD